jgi:hypothetical protein
MNCLKTDIILVLIVGNNLGNWDTSLHVYQIHWSIFLKVHSIVGLTCAHGDCYMLLFAPRILFSGLPDNWSSTHNLSWNF